MFCLSHQLKATATAADCICPPWWQRNISEGYLGLLPQIIDNYFIFLMIAIQSQEKLPVNLLKLYKMVSNRVASHKHSFLDILSD